MNKNETTANPGSGEYFTAVKPMESGLCLIAEQAQEVDNYASRRCLPRCCASRLFNSGLIEVMRHSTCIGNCHHLHHWCCPANAMKRTVDTKSVMTSVAEVFTSQ